MYQVCEQLEVIDIPLCPLALLSHRKVVSLQWTQSEMFSFSSLIHLGESDENGFSKGLLHAETLALQLKSPRVRMY